MTNQNSQSDWSNFAARQFIIPPSVVIGGRFMLVAIALAGSGGALASSVAIPFVPDFLGERTAAFAQWETRASHSADALAEIRQRTAMTWGEIAYVLGVTPRSLHLWVKGNEAKPDSRAKIETMLGRVRSLKGVAPFAIRAELLKEMGATSPLVDDLHMPLVGAILVSDNSPFGEPLKTKRRSSMIKVKRG